MRRSFPIIVLPIVLAAGYVHGRWTDRWSPSRAIATAVERLDRVPIRIGDWQGRDETLAAETVTKAGIDGYVMRRYVSERLGTVSMLLMCGRPGPIAAHTPELCYGGAGYEALADPVRCSIPVGGKQASSDFFTTVFGQPSGLNRPALRVLWAWNGGDAWEVSDNPRLSFARHRCLYKLYIVREAPKIDGPVDVDPTSQFAQTLLPVLQEALF